MYHPSALTHTSWESDQPSPFSIRVFAFTRIGGAVIFSYTVYQTRWDARVIFAVTVAVVNSFQNIIHTILITIISIIVILFITILLLL